MNKYSCEGEMSQLPPFLTSLPPVSPRFPYEFHFQKRKRGRPPLEKSSRMCKTCGAKSTPEWRRGPCGPHTLCNACGLQFMKHQKKQQKKPENFQIAATSRPSDGPSPREIIYHGNEVEFVAPPGHFTQQMQKLIEMRKQIRSIPEK